MGQAERRSTSAKRMKNRLKDHLAVLLPEEGPFPPHPGSRVSTHQQNRT
jgi:hypothetical protein